MLLRITKVTGHKDVEKEIETNDGETTTETVKEPIVETLHEEDAGEDYALRLAMLTRHAKRIGGKAEAVE